MIRLLNVQTDIPEVLWGYHQFIERIGPEFFPEDTPGELDAAFLEVLKTPSVTVFVDAVQGVLHGGIGLAVLPLVWNPKFLAAEEIFWFCKDGARNSSAMALIKAAKNFMERSGAKIISMSTMATSPVGVSRVYAGLGLKALQSTYAKVL